MEKVLVVAKTHMGQNRACIGGLSLRTFENVRLLLAGERNHPADTPFDGCLQSDGNSDKVFISRKGGIPTCSTGYWLTTLPLTRTSAFNKTYYTIQSVVHKGSDYYRATFVIAYVGFAEPLPEIPANTLIRVSMCRWFKREEYSEERCYLQISGWYL